MTDRFLFTGTGGSLGVPVIGCNCPVCTSKHPGNRRLRTAGVLYAKKKVLAVDAGPDFREQCLTHSIQTIDGLIVTHTHADHIHGVDDLRIFELREKRAVPCLLSKESCRDLEERFPYFFPPFHGNMSQTKKLSLEILEQPSGEVNFQSVPLSYFTYHQAGMPVLGLRYRNFAYITDIQTFTDGIFDFLHGVDTLVVSALRWTPSLVHFTVEDALSFIDKVGAKRALLTHIAHDLEHEDTNARLPAHVRVAYDGLEVSID